MVLIFDLDGVVYLGESPIPGAVPALRTLDAAGHRLFFLTNNSTRSRVDYARKLAGMGYPATADQVMTSAYATALYLREHGASGRSVYVVGESGLREEMALAGLRVLGEGDPGPADYVVAGLDRQLTYAKLRRAHEEITVRGARFVATNRDATYPMEGGEIPGGGAIVAPIECSTGCRGITIGKPEPAMWERILQLASAAPGDAWMVGDRPETDILGAKRLGLRTVLVLTGVTTAEKAEFVPPDGRADFVIPALADLPALLAEWIPAGGRAG